MNKPARSICILACLSASLAACRPQVRITEKEVVITSIATKVATVLPTHTPLPTHTTLPTHTAYPTSTHTKAPSIPTNTPTNTSIAIPVTDNISTAPPQNTQQSTSEPTATFTSTPPTTVPDDTETIQMPSISDITSGMPNYNRSEWSHWSDADKDCQNTRHEVLIAESISPVLFKSTSQCQVNTGLWYDPFVGTTVSEAGKLDVDHMVPLHNAHVSGGWMWSASVKKAFANDLSDADHLIAVTASANRSKGSRAPDQWKPTNQAYWCEYAKDWSRIKYNWGLTVTTPEYSALQMMLSTCTDIITLEHSSGDAINIILQEINVSAG